ncbi:MULTISPECIES: hypothetical protein [Haloferacaceae]|uniref:Uncharacterized protein n=2 Tax=Haloferacaceae TaxID=1644056 RepID=A0ABD6DF93_9EURY|nr:MULTISPECIES: hypothetical protein [Halorubraceae]
MNEFETTLKNTDHLTEETAQNLREELLAALECDNSWILDGDSAEPCVDETGDWHLFTLIHEDSHDRSVTVLIHAVTLSIQTYLEPAGVYTEPSQSIEHIQTALSD